MEHQKGSILSALEVLETMKNSLNEVKSATKVTNIVNIDNYELDENDIKITTSCINIPSQPPSNFKNTSPKQSNTSINSKLISKNAPKVMTKAENKSPKKDSSNKISKSPEKNSSNANNNANENIKEKDKDDKAKVQVTRTTTSKGINMITIKNFNINLNIKDNKDFSNMQALTDFNIKKKPNSPVVSPEQGPRTYYQSPTQKANVLAVTNILKNANIFDKNVNTNLKTNTVKNRENNFKNLYSNNIKAATSLSPGGLKTLVTKKLGNTPKLPLIKKK